MAIGAISVSLFFWLPLLACVWHLPPSHLGNTALPDIDDLEASNSRPVIGVLACRCVPPILDVSAGFVCDSFIPLSYAQWIEQAGARVVPLYPGMSDEHFDRVLSKLNGVVTIGGFWGPDNRAPPEFAKIWHHALKLGESGEVFPIWGTCQGMEDILQMASGLTYPEFLFHTDAADLPLPLKFQPSRDHDGMFFNEVAFPGSSIFRQWFSNLPISYHHHDWGISPQTLATLPNASNMFVALAISQDRRGSDFVSVMAGTKLPIYASAFHPEKPQFEWPIMNFGFFNSTQIPHSRKAILANSHLGAVFVSQARKSNRRFDNHSELMESLIYNSKLQYTATSSGLVRYFAECYIF